jgi:taurine dioxygenase
VRTQPLCDALGVEVRGLDLSRPLGQADQDELRATYRHHRLLLFRGQSIAVEDHVRLARCLGPVREDQNGVGYVSNVRSGGFVPGGRLFFHSDFAFTAEPCLGISLYALDVPAGCPTVWANAARAATVLAADLRAAVADAQALHLFDLRLQRGDVHYREDELPDEPLAPRWIHPVLLRHPVTGEQVLYVSEMQTDRVLGADRSLLPRLLETLYDDANTYRHEWSVGDIVVWDNVALQHARPVPPPAAARTLHRVAISDRSIFDLVPEFAAYVAEREGAGA